MISRRNYFTITVIMFIVFFLFQFSNVALESWNHYEENSYIIDTEEIPGKSDAYQVNADTGDFVNDGRETVVYIGEKEGSVGETVSLWVTYTKRNMETYLSLEEYELSRKENSAASPVMIAVDPKAVDWDGEEGCKLLESYINEGSHLIFCGLPEVSVVKENRLLREILGIQTIKAEEMTADYLYLKQGFLLGGEAFYPSDQMEKGMEFTFPWYAVTSDSEIYLNGVPKDTAMAGVIVEESEFPAVIWRKPFETASVFAINGSYIEDVAGLGILSAIASKMQLYEIYPVVNAQNLVYVNYPVLANENEDLMVERYSQPLKEFFQNVVWPDMVAVRRESGAAISCMLAPELDYEDSNEPDALQFQRYMKLLNEQSAETGLSGTCLSGTPVEKKLAKDHEFMQEALPDYRFTSFYADGLTDEEIWDVLGEEILGSVRTIVESCSEDKEVISYLSEYVTRQRAVSDGWEDSIRKRFRTQCLETALGYSCMMINMQSIVYPEQDDLYWTAASNTLRKNLQEYRIGKQGFENTTVSECDERIREFFALDFKEKREFNSIYLERNHDRESAWFILRTNHELIEKMEGGSWKKLEDDAYLLEVRQKNAVITLKPVY